MDLYKYLEAIGVQLDQEKAVAPDFNLLTTIVAAHLKAFPYQNTELYLTGTKEIGQRKVGSLTPDFLFTQLVIDKRPGYCFQNIELLAWALITLGFKTDRHLVKLINKPSEQIDPVSVEHDEFAHECLIIELRGEKWLIDTAYANNSLRKPLKIADSQQKIEQDQYRLVFNERDFYLEMQTREGWFCLYSVDKEPKTKDEVQVAHQNLILSSKHFPIRDSFLKLGNVTDNKRKALVFFKENKQGFFKSFKDSECRKNTTITSFEEFENLASKKFNITIDEEVKKLFQ